MKYKNLLIVAVTSLGMRAYDATPEQHRVVSLVYGLYQQGKHITVKTSNHSCISDPRTERVLKLRRKESADFLKNSGTLSSLISQYTPEHLAQELPLDLTAIDVKEFKTLQQWLKGLFPTHTDDELRRTLRAADLLKIHKEHLLNALQHAPLRQLCSLWLSDRDIADYPLKSLASVGPLFEKYLQEKCELRGYQKRETRGEDCFRVMSANKNICVTHNGCSVQIWQRNESGNWQLAQCSQNAENKKQSTGSFGPIGLVALAADGRTLVTAIPDAAVAWQQDESGCWCPRQTLEIASRIASESEYATRITSLAVSDDGGVIVTTYADFTAALWRQDESGSWQLSQELGMIGDYSQPGRLLVSNTRAVAISADGKTLAIAPFCGSEAFIWQQYGSGSIQQEVQRLGWPYNKDQARGHVESVRVIAISVDGKTAVTGSFDCTAIVWQLDKSGAWCMRQRLGTVGNKVPVSGNIGCITKIAISNDSKTIATQDDDITIVWQKEDIDDFCQRVIEHPLG